MGAPVERQPAQAPAGQRFGQGGDVGGVEGEAAEQSLLADLGEAGPPVRGQKTRRWSEGRRPSLGGAASQESRRMPRISRASASHIVFLAGSIGADAETMTPTRTFARASCTSGTNLSSPRSTSS